MDIGCVGRNVGPIERPYRWQDAVLYALAVGSGFDELPFCRESDQRVIPTFGITASFDFIKQCAIAAGANLDGVLHAGQSLEFVAPIPPSGVLRTEGEIVALYDKGKDRGALLIAEAETTDGDGTVLMRNRCTLLCRKDGGFGGERGPSTKREPVEGAPAVVVREHPPEDQPLLYRLLGDVHPLHADPTFAKRAGFDRPIMHGLSTFGYACRAALAHLCDGDVERLVRLGGRFVRPLYPGRPIRTEIWPERGHFRVVDDETSEVVVDAGELEVRGV